MTDKTEYTHVVESLPLNRWSSNHFETLKQAEEYARAQAYAQGCEYGIFKMVAKAEKPEIINDVKITAVQ